jgi:signal transduction histidine kinase
LGFFTSWSGRIIFDQDRVRLTIQDNGCGFDAPGQVSDLASSGRLGLIGMHERTRTLRGALTIQSAPGQGTIIIVDAPL